MKLRFMALRAFSAFLSLSLLYSYAFPGKFRGKNLEKSGHYILKGDYDVDGQTVTHGGAKTLSSNISGQNVVLAQNGGILHMDNVALHKTGDYTDSNGSDFYAVNSVVASESASKIYLSNANVESKAQGANSLFASGENSKICAYKIKTNSTKNSSRAVSATYNGTVIASDIDVFTQGDCSPAISADRENGNISVNNSRIITSGRSSPLVYSTGIVELDTLSAESANSSLVDVEGSGSVKIKNSLLTGANSKAEEPIYNGIMLYRIGSDDSNKSTANFEVSDSTLTSHIKSGTMFYATNTTANITLQNTKLDFNSEKCHLIYAAGNNGANGWGSIGSNGADVTFSATDQALSGNVLCDGVSTVNMYLKNSEWTGTTINDTTYKGRGKGINLYLGEGAVWNVGAPCIVNNLYVSKGAKVNGLENVVVRETEYYNYNGSGIKSADDFTIDRGDFNSYYNISEEINREEEKEISPEDNPLNTTYDSNTSPDYKTFYIATGVAVAVILAGIIIWVIKKKPRKLNDKK